MHVNRSPAVGIDAAAHCWRGRWSGSTGAMADEYRVPRGQGIFHYHKPSYSPETRSLINTLMRESRLSTLQREQVLRAVDSGDSLPPPRRLRHRSAPPRPAPPRPWQGFQRRSRDSILKSGAYDRDQFRRTSPIVDKDKEKQKLASLMAYGREVPPTPARGGNRRPLRQQSQQPEIDRFDELVEEVRDRLDFLRFMSSLGEGKRYEAQILQEAGAKIRQLRRLDHHRADEVQRLVDELGLSRKPAPCVLPSD